MMNLSLRVKLFIMTSLIAVIGFGSAITLVSSLQEKNAKQKALALTKSIANEFGFQVKAELELSLDAARTMAYSFEGLKVDNVGLDRQLVNTQLKRVLERNPHFFGTWTCWEPNAFDNNDANFAGKEGYDKTGRLIPYWSRPDGQMHYEPIVDYDKPESDFYMLPKKTHQETILDPFYYPVAGKQVLMTSVVVPILDKNEQFMGVAGVDLDMQSVQKLVGQFKLPYGEMMLISNKGIIAANKDPQNIFKNIGDLYPELKSLPATISAKQTFDLLDEKTQTYFVAVPVQFGTTQTPWAFLIHVPFQDMLADVHKTHTISVIASIVAILALGILILLVLHYTIHKPLDKLEKGIVAITNTGRFKQKLDVQSNDEIGRILLAFNQLVTSIDNAISNIKLVTQGFSQGNLQVRIADQFNGDLEELKQNINCSIENLSQTLSSVVTNIQQVAVSANQTSNAIGQVAEGSTQQLETIEHIVEAIDHNVALLKNARTGLQNAGKNTSLSTESSQRGEKQIQRLVDIAQNIVDNSTKINQMTSIIGEIAEKTNLLALNAAIESARAGESGRGFAVVADEVRKLAENSASQVNSITQLVSEGVQQAHESLNVVQEVYAAIQEINDYVVQNHSIFTELQTQIGQQSESMQHLNQQASVLRNIAETNSSSAMEVSSTVQNLSDLAKDTRSSVENFKI